MAGFDLPAASKPVCGVGDFENASHTASGRETGSHPLIDLRISSACAGNSMSVRWVYFYFSALTVVRPETSHLPRQCVKKANPYQFLAPEG